MLFSVIIPTCCRHVSLADCLRRLRPAEQALDGGAYEIIVSDDGAADPAEALVRDGFPGVRWTPGPRRGPAANRNHGASLARGEWLVFIDDDCQPQPGLLAAYAAARRAHPDVVVFEGRTSAARARRHPLEDAPINTTGGHLWSCNLAVAGQVFRALGGFNEAFPFAAMEDMDFRRRLEQRGFQHCFVPDAEAVHPWRTVEVKNHVRRHVASQLIYARLHPEDRSLFTVRQHCRNVARYYLRDFASEVRSFGWLALRCQPLRWWEFLYRGRRLWRGSSAGSDLDSP